MSKFVIKTKENIFEPIEFEVDGVVYTLPEKLDSAFLSEIQKFHNDPELQKDEKAVAKQFAFYTGCPLEVADLIDVRILKQALGFFMEQIEKPTKLNPELKKKDIK